MRKQAHAEAKAKLLLVSDNMVYAVEGCLQGQVIDVLHALRVSKPMER